MAVYAMTVIGWRVCWHQRYRRLISEDEMSRTDDSSELSDLQLSNPSINDMGQTSPGDGVNSSITETNTTSSKVI